MNRPGYCEGCWSCFEPCAKNKYSWLPPLYKHKNMTDVAVEVVKKYYIKEKDMWSFKFAWWNIGNSHPPWPMIIFQRFKIDAATWRNDWERYHYEEGRSVEHKIELPLIRDS